MFEAISLSKLSSEIINNYNLTDFSVSSINLWVRSNIGKLNNYLNTSYYIAPNSFIYPDISGNDKVVLFKIFELYYYNKLAKDATCASNYTTSVEVSEDSSLIRKTNRTEVYKTYNRLAAQSKRELLGLLNDYGYNHGISVNGLDGES